MRNRIFILLLGVGILYPDGSRARRWNTNKDSIVVDAYSEDEDEGELHFDALDQPDNIECMTLDHEPGMCITLRRCHPILFGENGELRNPSLAQDYIQNIDACGSHSVNDDANGFIDLERAVLPPKKSPIADQILCCAKDKIQSADRQRSSLQGSDEELAIYPTTTGIPAVPFAQEAEQVTQVEELLLEEVFSESSSTVPEPAVEAVESTGRPDTAPEPFNEAVATTVLPIATSSAPSMPDYSESSPQASSPAASSPPEEEPELPPQETNQEQVQQTNLVETQPENMDEEVCPAVNAYKTWPSFESYPFLASIQVRANTGPLCSGSLIDNKHILTAAHCLHRFNSKDVARMQVRIGFSKNPINDTYNDFYIERKASKIIFHKRFHEQSKMDNNIALVQLDHPVEFDDHVAPIRIFNGARGFDQGNCAGLEAGWIKYGNRKVTGISGGVIQYVEPPMSDFVLREAINKIFKNVDCQTQLYTEITDDMLCAKMDSFEAQGVSTDRFRGNDGGPLLIRIGDRVQQVGIKSWAYEGHQYPAVYTRVSSYLNWISENLQM